jgi:hypothetical protein
MDLAARIDSEIDFEELLSDAWASQLKQLRARRDSGALQIEQVQADSQEATGKEGDAGWTRD